MKDTKSLAWLLPLAGLLILFGWFLGQKDWSVSKINPPGIELVPPTATPESISILLPTITPSTRQVTLPQPTLPAKGILLYEDTFDSSSGWNIEEGVIIENGSLIIQPGYDAVPKNPDQYGDFIFETRFYIPQSGSLAFYFRHQRPPCADWNCSIQIALYFGGNYQEIAARRFLGDKPTQQFDIKKAKAASIHPSNWNKIVVRAKGYEYSVYINDTFVLSLTDNTYTSGAFIVDNASNSSDEIKLDYIRIYQVP